MATLTTPARRPRFALSPRLERWLNIASIVLIILLLATAVLWRIQSNYLLELPSTAQPVDPKIYVSGHPIPSGRGQLLMTFVEERRASLLEQIFSRVDPDASLQELPPHYSEQQDVQFNQQMMLSSTQTAELVALCQVGYKQLCGGGVLVTGILPYSKAGGLLRLNDVIVAVDGQVIATPDELRAALQRRSPGATFTVTVQRANKRLVLKTVPSVKSPHAPYGTALGVSINSVPLAGIPSPLPLDMKIDPGNIGGPSAGLMFTLGILNRISPTDLTRGACIAGTGTIGLDGTVGAIGGVKQKVIGAQWAHAGYFFVPRDGGNYDDARKVVGSSMKLVPVNTLSDALAFLKSLPPGQPGCHS